MNFEVLDKCRINEGAYKSNNGDCFGSFKIPYKSTTLRVICSPMDYAASKGKWQHVSVSLPNRCPNWNEMCFIKDLFWNEDETIVQFHPKKSEYIDNHSYCLHLWKMRDHEYELPPSIYVGVK